MKSKRNVPRLYVQAIFALAAALALTTSACGGKNEGQKPSPVTQTPSGTPPVTDTNAVGNVAGSSDADRLSSTSSSIQNGSGRANSGGGEPEDGAEPAPGKSRVYVETPHQSVVYQDENGLTADQLFARKDAVDLAGPLLGEAVRSDISSYDGSALFYSGSSTDTLREELYTFANERANRQHDIIRAGDKQLSESIQLASFDVDLHARRAVLEFTFERVGASGRLEKSTATLRGPLDSLSRFRLGSFDRFPYIVAEVACMDNSGGCKTVHIRAQDNSTGNIRTAHLIARHTEATLVFKGNGRGQSKNAEYDRLVSLLVNTENKTPENRLSKLTLTTSETIGGASNFKVGMEFRLRNEYGRGGDTVEVTGPLAKPRNTDALNVSLKVAPAVTLNYFGEMISTDAIGTEGRIVDTIREARLIRNDGRGNLQLELTVRNAKGEVVVGATEDRIVLTVGRIHTPTMSVRIPMQ